MNIDELVTNRELSKKLKALGYPQKESCFYRDHQDEIYTHAEMSVFDLTDSFTAAPLTDELLKHMPEKVYGERLALLKYEHNNRIYYGGGYLEFVAYMAKPSEVIAELLIRLVEDGLVKFEKFEEDRK